jgi:glutamate formiminotransferase/formiminotetrahydrofolate cyclodeaminase
MPQNSEEEKQARHAKMQAGLKTAINIPLTTMRFGNKAWDSLLEVARYGNPASKSDTQVGAKALKTGIWGAYQNVLINMVEIEDDGYRQKIMAEAEQLMHRARQKCAEIIAELEKI